ncbi:hypothetical protein TS65_12355 [Aneurinibacillus migulanus]|uniref:Uncharacterized protein n=1 Tax=Aneurinibacillus migulanus TaxID=47500 RepID=A0A0D1XWY6_ANEMI|nr:hypothetical protein TS65_12355 [Aneurinibacillus migulanus]KON95363.1 hypothetical protein AF333_07575 [Aneurinibacillus migulanus]
MCNKNFPIKLTGRNSKAIITNKNETSKMQSYKQSLIKSGGGTGPMKPGNRQKCKVLNPAKQCALEDESDGTYLRSQPSSSRKRVFLIG